MNAYDFSITMLSDDVLLSSVSGNKSFDTNNEAGAAITEAVINCEGSAPNDMYAARTVPLTVANPLVIIECISECVSD